MSSSLHLTAGWPVPSVPAPVDAQRVVATLREMAMRFFVDDEGDIGIPWRVVTVRVIFQDTRVLQLRGMWHRVASAEHLVAIRRLVEEWNGSRIGPKAYISVSDRGTVRLFGETMYPLAAGMTDQQLEDFLFNGCRVIVALMREAEELFPDPLRGKARPSDG